MERHVLADQLSAAIGQRKVTHAVFTTYTFEPDFFELEVLPLLFDRSFSQDAGVKRVHLSFSLREIAGIELYYDYNAFDSDVSCRLDYTRIPVRNGNNSFHPKVILLLVRNADSTHSLIVMAGSANLTRSGHWENLECFHTEEIEAGATISYRESLLGFLTHLKRLDRTASVNEGRSALQAIRDFVLRTEQGGSSRKIDFYSSSTSFTKFCASVLGPRRGPWTLEILSPFFAERSDNQLHEDFIRDLNLKTIHVYLPLDDQDAALCKREYFDRLQSHPQVKWCTLKDDSLLVQQKETRSNPSRRTLHAKVYRFFSKEQQEEFIFTGSVNFSVRAFSPNKRMNLEAGFLVGMSSPNLQPLLKPIDAGETQAFQEELEPPPGEEPAPHPWMAARYDWRTQRLEFAIDLEAQVSVELLDNTGLIGPQFAASPADWQRVEVDVSRLEQHLKASSFLRVHVADLPEKKVMVQELGMSNKPSLLETLTPKQILELWTTLDPEEKMQLLARFARLCPNLTLPTYQLAAAAPLDNSFFSQFAQIHQSFNKLNRHLEDALEAGNSREFEYYLFGQDADGLPALLEAALKQEVNDRVFQYFLGLSARETLDRFASRRNTDPALQSIFEANCEPKKQLTRSIEGLLETRDQLDLQGFPGERSAFFDWFEKCFRQQVERVGGEA